jgi:hypothetical protein
LPAASKVFLGGVQGTFPDDVPPGAEGLAPLLGKSVGQDGLQPARMLGVAVGPALGTLSVGAEQAFLNEVTWVQARPEASVHPSAGEGQQAKVVPV